MTPERLQEIRARAAEHATHRTTTAYDHGDRLALLGYIDVLHEDLCITRAERDAEKKKLMQMSKDHAAEVLAWDASAEDGRVKAWDEGYEEGRNDGWHDTRDNTPNPYRKDTK